MDVQRGGPSTGLPTLPAQADMMQVKWGSHGDYEIIALCPSSPQECFDLAIKAFNLAEKYRVPTFLMLDEVVGHMTEKVVIPPADQIEIEPRRFTNKKPGEFKLFEPDADGIPEMVKAGDGYNIHVTGLTHDERGYPNMSPAMQDTLVRRLQTKILNNAEKIWMYDEQDTGDADVVVVCYGITARVAQRAIDMARARGRQGRQVPADHRLAVSRQANTRTGCQGEGVCRARAEPRTNGARSRARGRRSG
jgi:2-oxoglutarate ferredoxin oxidoreductase subunit alpha